MSNESNQNKNGKHRVDWSHLREAPAQPKGPEKPWNPEMESAANEFVDFLKDAGNKKALTDFIVDTYRKFEAQRITEFQSRLENEKKVNDNTIAPHHVPGNIEPILAESLSMHDTEQAFARGLRATKSNLVRSVDERVDEINRLLAGIGGFSSQLRSCFARSTVVFLEQEDPKHTFRERLVFSINLPNYELKRAWGIVTANGKEPVVDEKKAKKMMKEGDGRTPLQATWDDAVNALAKIIASTGLKPKYCKNDRHYGRFVMKQDLRSTAELPDEYFSFTLDYNTSEKIKEMCVMYNKIVKDYDVRVNKLAKKLAHYSADSISPRYAELKKKHLLATQEREFFVGTVPDPNQLDEGLLFLIEVSTSKDYHVVKDRMQSIMTKYILHLSKIAVQDSLEDEDLEYEMKKLDIQKQSKQAMADAAAAATNAPMSAGGRKSVVKDVDLDSIPQYVVEEGSLKQINDAAKPSGVKKKKAA